MNKLLLVFSFILRGIAVSLLVLRALMRNRVRDFTDRLKFLDDFLDDFFKDQEMNPP